jgi:hypothetical protein
MNRVSRELSVSRSEYALQVSGSSDVQSHGLVSTKSPHPHSESIRIMPRQGLESLVYFTCQDNRDLLRTSEWLEGSVLDSDAPVHFELSLTWEMRGHLATQIGGSSLDQKDGFAGEARAWSHRELSPRRTLPGMTGNCGFLRREGKQGLLSCSWGLGRR